ncbi:hypothetical protein D9M71_700390 [compost metagenome]
MPHIATARISNGGTTAPVERTTPDTTNVTPKNRKDHTEMWLRWRPISSAGLSPGRNSASVLRSSRMIGAINAPVSRKLNSTPVRAVACTRSQRPAPTFCAAIDEHAAPMAIAGICT